ncbi:Non-canonical purine NTP pyrophosphatase [Tissierella creatinophila DSM 6911]|uniref:dITP/XTP pyrophosphatase n=2 Tax=Tissierella creatinophila TaxID=79681 RepID=A0A1U7M756_TISCR|nr:Non-canonical purine NTP pyrophosphatase [Tissierella creatinophila DSM 6911]
MKDRKIVLSTDNKHKIKEMKEILKDLDIEVLSKEDIGLNNFDVVEDGTTLEENSIKKAKALKEKTPFMVMADDSGLFVESLNGEPGVYSARYAGEEGNDDKNNQKLLQMMKDLPMDKRKASFFSVIALITENGEVLTVKGECKGSIGFELKGHNDFGYDPLFTPEGYEKTFAELSGEVKNKISHRAKALEEIKKTLTNLLEN